MEFKEKAKIRIDHWLKHNKEHAQEYKEMAQELHNNGFSEAAQAIMDLAENTSQGNIFLQKAISSLKNS